jgi:hypothetical protein
LDAQVTDKSALTDAQARRITALKRAFQRELGRKPTLLQSTLIQRACVMTAKAEAAALDPSVTTEIFIRIDGRASKARQIAFDAIAAAKPAAPAVAKVRMRPLSQCLAEARAQQR